MTTAIPWFSCVSLDATWPLLFISQLRSRKLFLSSRHATDIFFAKRKTKNSKITDDTLPPRIPSTAFGFCGRQRVLVLMTQFQN
jgi:hypothetical protein